MEVVDRLALTYPRHLSRRRARGAGRVGTDDGGAWPGAAKWPAPPAPVSASAAASGWADGPAARRPTSWKNSTAAGRSAAAAQSETPTGGGKTIMVPEISLGRDPPRLGLPRQTGLPAARPRPHRGVPAVPDAGHLGPVEPPVCRRPDDHLLTAPGHRLCGPACTVKVFPGDNLMVHKSLDVAEPGDIVVDGRRRCAHECRAGRPGLDEGQAPGHRRVHRGRPGARPARKSRGWISRCSPAGRRRSARCIAVRARSTSRSAAAAWW